MLDATHLRYYLLLPVTTATFTQSSVGADMVEWSDKMVSRNIITLTLLRTPHCSIGEHSEASHRGMIIY